MKQDELKKIAEEAAKRPGRFIKSAPYFVALIQRVEALQEALHSASMLPSCGDKNCEILACHVSTDARAALEKNGREVEIGGEG